MNGRVPSSGRYQPTDYEHAANCATHGLWIIPSLVGGSVLYFLSVDQWQAAAAWLYGAGLSGLFISSTLFHTVAWKIRHLRLVSLFHTVAWKIRHLRLVSLFRTVAWKIRHLRLVSLF
uniref:Monocyte to macrophage differentiation associated 2 n=1 Tax=Hucho hucho TaxID=62062 RepID=A0A4W5KRC7_9TELE